MIRDFIKTLEPYWTILLVPLWQEIIFRYLPYQLWYVPSHDFWLVGVASSIIFAAIHWYCGKWFVLAAFVAGLAYWFMMVEYGLFAAMLAHALVNGIDIAFGLRRYFTQTDL